MNDHTETSTPPSEKQLFVKIVISNWELQNSRLNALLVNLTDEQLSAQVAPGRNRGIYLLGHLAAVSDGMLPLLGLGNRLFPEWEELFVKNADNFGISYPRIATLRVNWNQVNETLAGHFATMQPEDWFSRHTAISEDAFVNEPHRNKLNILVNRTNHQAYHLGQLIFLK
jgi:hypothetical protein